MAAPDVAVLAGTASTSIFVASYLPMLVKAVRSKDLSSYSVLNLVLANVGNTVHSIYVFSLPPGPLWALHSFYLVGSALMLLWWVRYRRKAPPQQIPGQDRGVHRGWSKTAPMTNVAADDVSISPGS
jgi:uncharacterized protein with PQ loop repeat